MVYNNRKNIEKSTILSWLYFLARWKFTRFFILFLALLFLLFIFLLTSSNITFTFLKVEDRSLIIFDKKNLQKNERYLEEHGNHGNDILVSITDKSTHTTTLHESTAMSERSDTSTLLPIEYITTTDQIQSTLDEDDDEDNDINIRAKNLLKVKPEEEINQSNISMPLDNYIKGYEKKMKALSTEVEEKSITTSDSENLDNIFVKNTPTLTNGEKSKEKTVENTPSTYKVTPKEINDKKVEITYSIISNLKRIATNKLRSEDTTDTTKDTEYDMSSVNVDFVTGKIPSTISPRTTTLPIVTTLLTTTTLLKTTTLESLNDINQPTASKLTEKPKVDLLSKLAVKQISDQRNIEPLQPIQSRAQPGQSSTLLGQSRAQPGQKMSKVPGLSPTLPVQSNTQPGQFSTQPHQSSIFSQQIENTVTFNKLLSKGTPKKCKPVENVIFLKTHKTGSSTLINIFQRYAENHNLSIALPGTSHFLGWPNTFKEEFIFEYKKGKKYNFICNHARFQKEKMLNVMKSKDTKIVTIVRDPLLQFESTAVYLHFDRLFRLSNSTNIVDAFFNKSPKYIRSIIKAYNTQSKYLAKNPNAYDMGFPTWEGRPSLEYTMTKVKRDFDLVMVSDYMAESLILLKDLLCWDMKDIVYFTMNKRPKKYRQDIKNIEKARAQVSNWNDVDTAIFQYYNKTFWQEIEKKGEEFKEDLKLLRAMNGKLEETCLDKGEFLDKTQPWFPIEGFKLKPSTKQLPYKNLCKTMTKSEISYNNFLKKKHSTNNWPRNEKKILVTQTYKKS